MNFFIKKHLTKGGQSDIMVNCIKIAYFRKLLCKPSKMHRCTGENFVGLTFVGNLELLQYKVKFLVNIAEFLPKAVRCTDRLLVKAST